MAAKVGTKPGSAGSNPGSAGKKASSGSVVCTVLLKELREIFRDRRTLFTTVASPLLITPLLLALVGTMIRSQVRHERTEVIPVALVGAAHAPALQNALKGPQNLRYEERTAEQAEQEIREHRLRAALLFPPDAEQRVKTEREIPVKVLIDGGNDSSQKAGERLKTLLQERGKRLVALRLMEHGLSTELASPFAITQEAVKGGGTESTLLVSMFLPYILVISSVVGCVYAANDLVAGEKERGTLETLLVTPASRRDLVLGKYLAAAAVSLISSILSITGLTVPFLVRLPGLDWLADANLRLTPGGVGVMFLLLGPLAVLGAGLLLALSTYSRNQKEAQTYLGPVMLLVTVAAMLSMIMRVEASRTIALVPILNAALALRQALSGSIDPVFVAVAFVASTVYAGAATWFAAHLFERERVLLKS